MLEDTIDKLANEAMDNIDKIIANLMKYKAAIDKDDNFLSRGKFTSDGVSSKPFYIWKNDKNKNLISDLLTGEKIAVKSDVTSLQGKDAIKFNEIDLNFKSSNQTETQELRQKLNGFKVTIAHMGNSY